jgi:hypothetical protein
LAALRDQVRQQVSKGLNVRCTLLGYGRAHTPGKIGRDRLNAWRLGALTDAGAEPQALGSPGAVNRKRQAIQQERLLSATGTASTNRETWT